MKRRSIPVAGRLRGAWFAAALGLCTTFVQAAPDKGAEGPAYSVMSAHKARQFHFGGDRPFVNPDTGAVDAATMQFNGRTITEQGIRQLGPDSRIRLVSDRGAGRAVRVEVRPEDQRTAGAYRTQLHSYPVEPYRTYVLDLEFKLQDWDFDMPDGRGLLWQLKGHPKPGQAGNPVMALNLHEHELKLTVLYPKAAEDVAEWGDPVEWTTGPASPKNPNGYLKLPVASRDIEANRYYHVHLEFFADDRPAKFGGRGYLKATLDGEPWMDYHGPTLHPDQAGPHNTGFGWYQYGGRPKSPRVVLFKTVKLSAKD